MDEAETREQKLLRVLYHLARVEIAQVSTGFVATSGKAQIAKPLQSPLLGRECIAYQLAIFYRPTSQAFNWLQIPEVYQCADFVLKDAFGETRIVGEGADVALVHPQGSETLPQQPADLRHILSPLGYRQDAAAAWYVKECVLLDGDETFVAGVASREPVPGTQGGYRDTPQVRTVLQCQDGLPLAISNNRLVRTTSPENVSTHTL